MKFFGRSKLLYFIVAIFLISMIGYVPSRAQEDNVNIHVKVEVSADNGTTWYNYAGTEDPGNQTLTAHPGDTILTRIEIWNSGTEPVINVVASGSITNVSYLDITNYNANADHDPIAFGGYFFTDTGTGAGTLSALDANDKEADAQMVTATAILSTDFPVGTTYISGQVTITDYDLIGVGYLHSNYALAGIAQAAGRNRLSSFRVAVTVNEDTSDDQTSEEDTSSQESDLPSTGCDCLNN